MASLHHLFLLLLLFLIPSAFAARGLTGSDHGKVNPLTPKAAALRYWSEKVPDGRPRPEFLVSKLSPLTVQKMAELQLLANKNALSTKLPEFCLWAHLFCFTDVTARQEKHVGPLHIRQVTDPIKNYSDGENLNVNSFVRDAEKPPFSYDKYNNYNPPSSNTGPGENLNVNSFVRDAEKPPFSYDKYNNYNPPSSNTGPGGNMNVNSFVRDAKDLPFSYDKYNNYKPPSSNTGPGENLNVNSFVRDAKNLPFLYHKNNKPSSKTGPGKNLNVNSFVRDAKDLPFFYKYKNYNPPRSNAGAGQFARNNHAGAHSGLLLSKYAAMEGIFFRESQLKEGKLVKMPDIKDKKPARSFLPHSITAKLPSTTAGLPDLLRIFKSGENSTFAYVVGSTLRECEQAPAKGETKRCVASAEDMIDFAVDILGHSATVKTTAVLGVNKGMVQIGKVEKINGGQITDSVSCHQRPFPYLVYLCHSVPKVRVYEADMLDPTTKATVNRGLAICHIDTSEWYPKHDSFILLGGGPGKIEVCHWIIENDMAWVRAD